MIVVNLRQGRPEDFVTGMKEGERERGVEGKPIEIGGHEGRIVRAPDDSYVAGAPAGACSIVIVGAIDRGLVEEAASVIGRG